MMSCFLLCRRGSAAGRTFKCIQCFPSPGSWLGLCNTVAAATGGSEHGRMRFEENGAVLMCQGPPGALSADAPSSTWAASAPGSCCSLLPGWQCLAPGSHRSCGCGGMVLAPLQSGGSLPMPGSGTTHRGWCQQAKEAMPVSLAVGWLFLLPVFTS